MFEEKEDNQGLEDQLKTSLDDFESRSNMVGLFNLLLKIDRRVNPDLYKKK